MNAANGAIAYFTGANHNSKSYKYKQEITGVTDANGTKNVEIMVPLNYLNNVWRTHKMSLINCEINLILACSKKAVIASNAARNKICSN